MQDERGTNRMPRPLDAYMALARNLPPHFEDASWLAETFDGEPVAVAYCWSNAAGDGTTIECDVLVHREWRRRGIGARLFDAILEESAHRRRTLLTWETTDAVPAAEAFSRAVGGEPARVTRTSDLVLHEVDWDLVAAWSRAERARAAGCSIEHLTGPYPPERLADAVAFHHVMQTAPRDDLAVGDVLLTPAHVLDIDRSLVASGRERWTVLARDATGECVGGTEVTFEPDDPAVAWQQNTGIRPDHRGLGLAKWAKGAMLQRLRAERPSVLRVRTGNAASNAPMLAINDALGFRPHQRRIDWQRPLSL